MRSEQGAATTARHKEAHRRSGRRRDTSTPDAKQKEEEGHGLNPDLEQILPHRPPMVLIDSLIRCDAETAEAAKTFTGADYGLDADGRVAEPMLIECLAQTVAAAHGYRARLHGHKPADGMLVGVSGFDFSRPARQGEPLRLATRITHRLGQFLVVEGSIRTGEELIAAGAMKLYIEDRGAHGP